MQCLHTFPPIHSHDASIIIIFFWIRIRLDFFKDLIYIVNIVKYICTNFKINTKIYF